MDEPNTELLPYVLQTISQKPNMCDTFDNLCREMKSVLSSATLQSHYGSFKKDLGRAVDFGKSLGILTITNNLIRVPFKLKGNKAPSISRKMEEEEVLTAQPRCKQVVVPPVKIADRPRKTTRRLQSRVRRRR